MMMFMWRVLWLCLCEMIQFYSSSLSHLNSLLLFIVSLLDDSLTTARESVLHLIEEILLLFIIVVAVLT